MIDSLGRSLLGLTLACAKCHDHKFDPIPTRDYYALAGILSSSEPLTGASRRFFGRWSSGLQPLEGQPAAFSDDELATLLKAANERFALNGKLTKAKRAAVVAAGKQNAKKEEQEAYAMTQPDIIAMKANADQIQATYDTLTERFNAALPHSASAMRDVPKPADCAIHIRGEETQLGEIVPRGFPAVLTTAIDAEGESAAERPHRTRAVDHQPGESADRARDGEPHLAAPLWRRHRRILR
jgi:hypothetical protein